MRISSLAAVLLLCFAMAITLSATPIADAINPSLSPCNCFWGAVYEGWTYTPTVSYILGDLETKWSSGGNSGTVGVAIYSGWSNGPVGLLGSSTMFANNNNDWSVADFSPIPITAGDTYYLFFSGTGGIGANLNFSGPGTITPYYWSTDDVNWVYFNLGYGMFQFSTAVPEPGSMLLLGSGLLAAAGAIRRKFNV